jgi:hypothetical protein
LVRTKGRKRVLVGVVADAEGGPRAGEAADVVVAKVFGGITESRSGNLNGALVQAMAEAGRGLQEVAAKKGMPGHVAATGIAVFNQRLFIAQAGNTQAFLVRGGKTALVTRSNDRFLGLPGVQEAFSAPAEGILLQPGDRIVVASASLTKPSPEDRRPFVDPSVIATHVEGSSALEGARHLVSVALGREVDTNLSVLVVEIPGGKRSGVSSSLLAFGVLVLAALVGLAWWQLPQLFRATPAGVPDMGYVVLLDGLGEFNVRGSPEGGFESVVRLGAVPAGAFLRSSMPSKLAFQSTNPSSPDLLEGQFHLAAGTEVKLELLDPHPNPGVPESDGMRSSSRLVLASGRVVVYRRGGSWEYQIGSGALKAVLTGQGVGAMGVGLERGVIGVSCLIGTCSLVDEGGGEIELVAGQGAEGDPSGMRGPRAVSVEQREAWDDLCRGCLSE